MATLEVQQYAAAMHVSGGVTVQIPMWPPLKSEIVDCSSAAAKTAAVLERDCAFVRLTAIGGGVRAVLALFSATSGTVVTASSEQFIENVPEFRGVRGAAGGTLGIHAETAA